MVGSVVINGHDLSSTYIFQELEVFCYGSDVEAWYSVIIDLCLSSDGLILSTLLYITKLLRTLDLFYWTLRIFSHF